MNPQKTVSTLLLLSTALFAAGGCGSPDDDTGSSSAEGDRGRDTAGSTDFTCAEFCFGSSVLCPEIDEDECLASCDSASSLCSDESHAFLHCAGEASGYDCEAEEIPGTPEGCDPERVALVKCVADMAGTDSSK